MGKTEREKVLHRGDTEYLDRFSGQLFTKLWVGTNIGMSSYVAGMNLRRGSNLVGMNLEQGS